MDYLSVEDARSRSGLRLVLTAGVPGPWGEAAKAVFAARNVPYLPVHQQAMQPNEELLAWTGHRNAPIACLDEEPPLAGWLDMVLLAERLGSGPSLLPKEEGDRALCLGFATAIAGPDGLGWYRRIQMTAAMLEDPETTGTQLAAILGKYDVRSGSNAVSEGRIVSILRGLAEQLERQKALGSYYFIGDGLTVTDLYWACFSIMLSPLPQNLNPMPDWLRPMYSAVSEKIDAAIDPILIAHRDRIYGTHIAIPLEY
jgi:glutathione S-transferase